MDTDIDHADLIRAARRREPGALRALAVSLDDASAADGGPLDGAVLAWRAVQGDRYPTLAGRMSSHVAALRRRLFEARVPFGPEREMTPKRCTEAASVLDRRSAA
jgi:hypothetical protein